jgi:uncharacterized protein YjbI with pentapeptide repeats
LQGVDTSLTLFALIASPNNEALVDTTSCSAVLTNWSPQESLNPAHFDRSVHSDTRGADWRGLNLGSQDFSNTRLCRVDLRGSILAETCLNGADLRLARYDKKTIWPEGFDYRNSGAIGPKAILNGGFLNSADLSGMDLEGCSLMGSHLSGANMNGACLMDVRFFGADLRYALLRGALCKGARFSGCQLDYADFRWADLANTDLNSAETIGGADFTEATDLGQMRAALLGRHYKELDNWNPITRRTTRDSLAC